MADTTVFQRKKEVEDIDLLTKVISPEKLREYYLFAYYRLMRAVVSSDLKQHENGNYTLIGDEEDNRLGYFDNPLPCFGCGIGWFCLLLGFVLPLMWYYATILYLGNYYRKDPRERTGLAASAIASTIQHGAGYGSHIYSSSAYCNHHYRLMILADVIRFKEKAHM
ncbi:hypothetical protein OSB04_030207 [Centaurea solstitialis]|uniref:Uncharacterized protein n=1 Tax=Centaurea solstitialis TaxID=347529 RepID=A0AA38S8C1_9ASTR|nr:hypothetical protein OSB04_030207 [Centaurea solstitialis]